MALKANDAFASLSSLEKFLLQSGVVTSQKLQLLKQEAQDKQMPLATILQSYGLMDTVQSKWEEVFRTSKWAKYPSEEMIRFVARNYQDTPARNDIHFLDIGCGIGATSWYLAKEGYQVSAMDCSPSAIEVAKNWFDIERLNADFSVGLMQDLPYADKQFDCVIDNGSSTSTPLPVIKTILNGVRRVLKPGGRYYGMFLGDETTIAGEQDKNADDPKFYQEITSGPIQRAATVRLLNREEIEDLFSDTDDLQIDYALRTVNNGKEKVQYWLVSAVFIK